MHAIRLAHQIGFGLAASGLIIVGVIGFLLPFGILPKIAAGYDSEGLHVVQEAGSSSLTLGLMALWCAFNYDRSRLMHCILLTFFFLISLLHWIDFLRDLRSIDSGLINSVPFVLFAVLLVLRLKTHNRETQGSRKPLP